MNTKSAYASMVLLIFIRNIDIPCDSITAVMRFADKQLQVLGIKNDLSESTKYSVVKDLLDTGILVSKTRKNGKKHKVFLSKKINTYIHELIESKQG